ncbi:hypothetical protein [Haloarchaeobius sp. DT45]|uniref:hypothetical protein n=1 Tax=Haloarchaeobius sp. DT45 TaxID=3446116 RepID=UPI003F6A7B92
MDDIDDGEPEILTLRVDQIDHISISDVNLIKRLPQEDVPVGSIPDRTLEWLIELGVVSVDDDGYARLKPDGVVFEPLVLPKDCEPHSED